MSWNVIIKQLAELEVVIQALKILAPLSEIY